MAQLEKRRERKSFTKGDRAVRYFHSAGVDLTPVWGCPSETTSANGNAVPSCSCGAKDGEAFSCLKMFLRGTPRRADGVSVGRHAILRSDWAL